MSNSIFDWDDEEEKKEQDQRTDFQQPVESVDYWSAQNEPQNSAWGEEPVEYIPYGHKSPENRPSRRPRLVSRYCVL